MFAVGISHHSNLLMVEFEMPVGWTRLSRSLRVAQGRGHNRALDVPRRCKKRWFCANSTRDEEIPNCPQNLLIPAVRVFLVRQCKLGGVLFTVEMSLLKSRRGRRCE